MKSAASRPSSCVLWGWKATSGPSHPHQSPHGSGCGALVPNPHDWESYRQSSEGPDEVCCLPDHPPASCGGGKRRQAPLTHTRAPTAAAAELWFPLVPRLGSGPLRSAPGLLRSALDLLRVLSGLLRSSPVLSGLLRSAPVCSGPLRSALDLLWICSGSAPVCGAGMVSRAVAIPLASL